MSIFATVVALFVLAILTLPLWMGLIEWLWDKQAELLQRVLKPKDGEK